MVVPQVDQIISKAAMSLNANYLICYLISPLSNYLANILMLFHLSNSWAKYFSPDTGKVFTLPWKLPGVLLKKDKAFNLEFFHLSHFRLHSHFLHLISAHLHLISASHWHVPIEAKATQGLSREHISVPWGFISLRINVSLASWVPVLSGGENQGTPCSNISWTFERRHKLWVQCILSKSCQNLPGNH